MNVIEQAKNEAAVLTEFLATVGKKLKHTQALEAIARIKGHASWTEFKTVNAADDNSATRTLIGLFRSQCVEDFTLRGIPHSVRDRDMDALNLCLTLALRRRKDDPVPTPDELSRYAVRVRCEDDSAQGIPFIRSLTVGEILYSKPRGNGWVLGGSEDYLAPCVAEPALALAA